MGSSRVAIRAFKLLALFFGYFGVFNSAWYQASRMYKLKYGQTCHLLIKVHLYSFCHHSVSDQCRIGSRVLHYLAKNKICDSVWKCKTFFKFIADNIYHWFFTVVNFFSSLNTKHFPYDIFESQCLQKGIYTRQTVKIILNRTNVIMRCRWPVARQKVTQILMAYG